MNIGRWSLRSQLIIVFTAAAFLLAIILVSLTIIQLQWIKSTILELSEEEIESFFENRMEMLLEEDNKMLTLFFQKHMNLAYLMASIFESIFAEMPIGTGTPHWSDDEGAVSSLDYGAFFSKQDELTQKTQDVVATAVAMDPIFKNLYDSTHYVYLYAGFNTDDLLYFYPASSFSDDTYSPYQREWFYKANQTIGEIQITDPFQDAFNDTLWLIAFSRSISYNSEVLGVSTVDIRFESIKDLFRDSSLGDSGYELLISKNGIVLGSPTSWNSNEDVLRIDEESVTGISSEQWEEIKDSANDLKIMTFTEPNGDKYRFIKNGIFLYAGQTEDPTHYLMVCMKDSEFTKKTNELDDDFSDLYNTIFWTVIGIASAFFLLIIGMIIWYTQKIIKSMRVICDYIRQLNLHAHKPNMALSVGNGSLTNIKKTMNGLYLACKEKKEMISNTEQHFESFQWKEVRPMDVTIYDNWRKILYPINKFKKEILEWNGVLEKLKKIT